MTLFLLTLGGLTLGGSAAILLLALAGRSTRARYGARWRCWAWALLCLRLALPFPLFPRAQESAPLQVDVPRDTLLTPNLSPTGSSPVPTQPPEPDPEGSGAASTSAPSEGGDTSDQNASEPSAALPLPTLPQILILLWGAGAAAVLIWNLAAHLRFLSYLRRWAVPVKDGAVIRAFNQTGDRLGLSRRPRLLLCPGLRTPMLAGLFRPALLLPQESLSGQGLEFSLLHELTHYRRRDIWLKALALWIKALYWFNPLSWWMDRLIERDTELACDEDALGRLPPEARGPYGQTILSAAARIK